MAKKESASQQEEQDPQEDTGHATINVTDGTLIPTKKEQGALSAWNLSFFGAIALLIILPIIEPDPYLKILSFVPDGLAATFGVTLTSIVFALIIGLFAGLGRVSANKAINRIATIYVEVIRGIPLLVQLFYIYYALGPLLKLKGPSAAVLAMSICYGAYMAEIFRAGIQAVPKGQMEAARSLGMPHFMAMKEIIMPQAIKNILPAIGNEFVAVIKGSSMAYVLGIAELTFTAKVVQGTTYKGLEPLLISALFYLVLTFSLGRLINWAERRMKASDSH